MELHGIRLLGDKAVATGKAKSFSDVSGAGVEKPPPRPYAAADYFQNFPDAALPVELRNRNAGPLWRLADNQLTKFGV